MNPFDIWNKINGNVSMPLEIETKPEKVRTAEDYLDAICSWTADVSELYRRLCRTQLRGRKHSEECISEIIKLCGDYNIGVIDDRKLDDALCAIVFKAYDYHGGVSGVDPKVCMNVSMYRLWTDLRYTVRKWMKEISVK